MCDNDIKQHIPNEIKSNQLIETRYKEDLNYEPTWTLFHSLPRAQQQQGFPINKTGGIRGEWLVWFYA
jgi:hypothetical protein